MTIDWEKLLLETSFDIIVEEEDGLVVKLKGGVLDNCNVHFSEIDLHMSDNQSSLDFDYMIESTDDNIKVEECDELRSFLANIIYSHILQTMHGEQ